MVKVNSNQGIQGWLKNNFLTGVAVIFPVFITVYLIVAIIQFVEGLTGKYLNSYLEQHLGFIIPGLGLIVVLLLILLCGFVYNYFFGDKILPVFEKLFTKIPVVSNIYPSAKELSQFLFGSSDQEKFEKVVSVEFPMKGSYSIGFITNDQVEKLNMHEKDKTKIAVFIPLAPTPVTGHIILVTKDKVEELDISVDEAVKFIVSGGVVLKKDESES